MSGHQHDHHEPGDTERWSAAYWDDRYATGETTWSGRVNRAVAEELADLPPGRALEVGCGTGADSIWLAARGWQVTATDVSEIGLRQAAEHARAELGEGADRVTWEQRDLLSWAPEPAAYDLVTGAFLHLPPEHRHRVHAGLVEAVAPGGTFLLVQHDLHDLDTDLPRPPEPDLFPGVEELLVGVGHDGWEVVTAESRPRAGTLPDGRDVTLHDTVLRLRRPGAS